MNCHYCLVHFNHGKSENPRMGIDEHYELKYSSSKRQCENPHMGIDERRKQIHFSNLHRENPRMGIDERSQEGQHFGHNLRKPPYGD